MEPGPEARSLYRILRRGLLRAAHHHRRAARPPGAASQVHAAHLDACRRQLGALRQAWRGTRSAASWNAYVRASTSARASDA